MNSIENKIICGDSTLLIRELESDSVHLILSDIPYEDYNQQEIDGKIIKTIPLWIWLLQ